MTVSLKHKALAFTALLTLNPAYATDKTPPPDTARYQDDKLVMVTRTRTPEQLAAFYAARGFNPASIAAVTKPCFVFGMVENLGEERLWLILDDWRFIDADGKPIERIKRAEWKQTWQTTGLPQAKQATFGWTQLPESRDLHRYEHVGGQLAIPWQHRPFTLQASFRTAPDQSGPLRKVTFEKLTCKLQ
jgi:hypothetical protein